MDASEANTTDPDAEAALMGQMLGFSAFGTQDKHKHAKGKKRKHSNPTAGAPSPAPKSRHPADAASAQGVPADASAAKREAGDGLDGEGEGDGSVDSTHPESTTAAEQGPQGEQEGPSHLPAQVPGQHQHQLPARPPVPPGWERSHSRQEGVKRQATNSTDGNASWWHGYYDPRFNQNPWERLEHELGIQPRGTWLAREAQA